MKRFSQSVWQRGACRAAAVAGLAVLLGLAPVAARACTGDCNGDGEVTIDEIITAVNISLGAAQVSTCTAADGNNDGEVTIDEIITAVNIALGQAPCVTPTPPPGGCGDGVVTAPEECDNGGTCVGGAMAGTHCTSDTACGLDQPGVCLGGGKTGYFCMAAADCPDGSCQRCRTFGGDGCAANCTNEVDVDYHLVPGVVQGLDIKAGTSGAVVHGEVLTIPLPITGQQKITIGKPSPDGTVPFVIKAASVMFPKIPVSTLACACVRGVPFKTCGGNLFENDGSTSPSCTDGFPGEVASCPAGRPCAFVHGDGNSATGTLGCGAAGLNGVNVDITQDAGGCGNPPDCDTRTSGLAIVTISGSGPKGSSILLNSTAIGQDLGACKPTFCTDADPLSLRGTPQTLPFTTGTATALVKNLNFEDGVDLVDPNTGEKFGVTGTPANCDALTTSPPSTSGFATVGSFPALGLPTVGDVVVTNSFNAQ